MHIVRRTRWLLVAVALVAGRAARCADEPPPCRSEVVPCNIGHAYSGTFHWVAVLKSSRGKTTQDVTVRISHGKAVCDGGVVSTDPSETAGSIKGAGLLALEWGTGTDEDDAAPWYRVSVACPGLGGASPPSMDGDHMDTYERPRRQGFARFEGSIEDKHPDADPGNGVTGTLSIEWKLARD